MSPDLGARVIDIANKLVGSHYINGGYGAMPGWLNGCPCRPGMVDLIADQKHLDPHLNLDNRPANLAVNAATLTIVTKKGTTYNVCAGSYQTLGGGIVSENDPALTSYLDSIRGTPPSTWPNASNNFTPRRAFGPGQTGKDGAGKLVWGQSCKNIRHFDCVGFISFCYWRATGVVMQLEISQWRTPSGDRKVTNLPSSSLTLMDGDILVKGDHHIAFVSADGTVIEAQDTHLGVRATSGFSPGAANDWTHHVRLADAGTDPLDWPLGWWRVYDGNNWFYYFANDGTIMSSKVSPGLTTRTPPARPHNTGTWVWTSPSKLVVTWKLVAGAPKPCEETFWNATYECEQMNANSNLYSPLVATRIA